MSAAPGFVWQRTFIQLLDNAFRMQPAMTDIGLSPVSRDLDDAK
ncbi:MAG: hypothetical protein ABI476_01210 [Oxalobacteraceae bacterium]